MDDEPFGVDLIRIHFGLLCRVILAVVLIGPPYQDDPSGSLSFLGRVLFVLRPVSISIFPAEHQHIGL